MKRILSLVLTMCLLLSGAALFNGCSLQSGGEWPVTVNDTTVTKEPQNIVVLNDVFADIISAIGYDVKIAGRSAECDQEYLYVVPTVGPAASPDTEAIAEAQADLVIADHYLSDDAKAAIEENGAQILTLEVPSDSDGLKALYSTLGSVLGGNNTGSKKGENGYDKLLEMLSTMNTATSNVVQTVAYLYMGGNNQLCTFVKGTLPFTFFNYNGNTNVFANQKEPYVNLDELRIGSPNYIFYDSDEVLDYLKSEEKLSKLNALKNKRTLKLSRKLFERYGSSEEQAIYEMLSFIEKNSKAEETAAPTEAKQAKAAEADKKKATEAVKEKETKAKKDEKTKPTEEETVAEAEQEEDVIVYTEDGDATDEYYEDDVEVYDDGYDPDAFSEDTSSE